MNTVSGLSASGLVIAFACSVFLAIVGIYIAWIIPLRIEKHLRELLTVSREQTALLRQLVGVQRQAHGIVEPVSELSASKPANETEQYRIPGLS